MKHPKLVIATGIIVAALATQAAQADFFGGVMQGAILGSLVDGRDGAATGAIVGGLVGAAKASGEKKREQQQQAEAQKRKDEWAAQEQAEQERIQKQQAAAAPAPAANQTLLIETQKALIRLGYEPGTLGQSGPELKRDITQYQKSKGLLETGELSQALLTHMLRNGG